MEKATAVRETPAFPFSASLSYPNKQLWGEGHVSAALPPVQALCPKPRCSTRVWPGHLKSAFLKNLPTSPCSWPQRSAWLPRPSETCWVQSLSWNLAAFNIFFLGHTTRRKQSVPLSTRVSRESRSKLGLTTSRPPRAQAAAAAGHAQAEERQSSPGPFVRGFHEPDLQAPSSTHQCTQSSWRRAAWPLPRPGFLQRWNTAALRNHVPSCKNAGAAGVLPQKPGRLPIQMSSIPRQN